MSRETLGHLQSAYCERQAKVTNANHNCFRELQYDLAKYASKDRLSKRGEKAASEQYETVREALKGSYRH